MSESEGSLDLGVLAALAYELKNPLTLMAGQLSLLSPKQKDKKSVNSIQINAEVLLDVIDSVVLANQVTIGQRLPKLEAFDIRRTIQKAQKCFTKEMKKRGQGFIFKTSQRLPSVNSDPNLTYQIMLNLIGHACLFAPEKTDISISVRLQENELQILVRNIGASVDQRSFNRAVDNIGVSQQPMPQNVGDTGLRLYIAQRIAESMNGQIRFIPSREGSCFALSLPTNEQLRLL